ncbi:hypothetical protein A3D03_02950 [Candidatus Gottesmanbacteria bacterium RIFCSPHIGHO2_02_FULL_40_13]|uniref:Uncharacterized protein n=1 Tax=Candidatus Gottesmanbacteria bacterium RIFCSPHIGHO2_02_FULL_40_13 TaxID=1798384 RepID=A0A1F6AAI6_9BACT|nr:MAG: hypothetical protein A3D03_02950 [Candidatus Gottesmanbacteria bacterium RIFCSPHIGHO2_02_FULL_40_13]
MIRTQVYLPEDIHRDLMLLAKKEGTNFSTLIREGARTIIKKKTTSRKKDFGKGFFGALKYGPKDLSVRINDIYK